MPISVQEFKLKVETDVSDENATLGWRITIGIKFHSPDPRDWGEFRAFAGSCSWSHGDGSGSFSNVVTPESIEKMTEIKPYPRKVLYEMCKELLPRWTSDGKSKLPRQECPPMNPEDDDLRLGNDQHMNIVYTKQVPGVPRSGAKVDKSAAYHWHKQNDGGPGSSKYLAGTRVTRGELIRYDPVVDIDSVVTDRDLDDENQIGPSAGAMVKDWKKKYHIVVSDEPSRANVMSESGATYWHQAEYRITDPATRVAIWSARLWLKLRGTMDDIKATVILDDVNKLKPRSSGVYEHSTTYVDSRSRSEPVRLFGDPYVDMEAIRERVAYLKRREVRLRSWGRTKTSEYVYVTSRLFDIWLEHGVG